MFRIDPAPTFDFDVALQLPGGQTAALPLTCRHKSKRELAAWQAGIAGRTDQDVLGDVVVGWKVADSQGEPVAFSPEALDTLLDKFPSAALQIHNAYLAELTEARRKN